MKIIKEKLLGKEAAKKEVASKRKAEYMAKKNEAIEVYDGVISIHGSEKEYSLIRNVGSYGYRKNPKEFMKESLENIDSLKELVVVDSGNEIVAKYAQVTLEKEYKDVLEKSARKAGLDVKDFVRAVLWTNAKNLVESHKETTAKLQENQRLSSGIVANLFVSGQLLSEIEREYGKITTSQKLNEVLPQILREHYSISK